MVIFKNCWIVNIAGGGLLLNQEHVKQRRKRKQWVRPWIRKRDSEGAYYSIINYLRLTGKEKFRKCLLLFYLNKN